MTSKAVCSFIARNVEESVQTKGDIFQGYAVLALFPVDSSPKSIILETLSLPITINDAASLIQSAIQKSLHRDTLHIGDTYYSVVSVKERTFYATSLNLQGTSSHLLLANIDRVLLVVQTKRGILLEQAILPFESLISHIVNQLNRC